MELVQKDTPSEILAPSMLNTTENTNHLEVSRDKLSVKYVGKGAHEHDVGAIRADHPLRMDRVVSYFEVRIVDTGRKGAIAVGLVDSTYSFMRHPGHESHSYGYHGDDGKKYSDGKGENYGPTYAAGDVIGCGIHCARGEIFFTKNGRHLGVAFRRASAAAKHFPTVALHSPGEAVSVNFGASPFRFDLNALIQDERDRSLASVRAQPLDLTTVSDIVYSYLLHSGFEETLKCFEAINHTPFASRVPDSQGMLATLSLRKNVRGFILAGNIDAAVKLVNESLPSLLEKYWKVSMRLQAQKFTEILRPGSEVALLAAIEFARVALYPFVQRAQSEPEELSYLNNVLGLLAYVNPNESPIAHLFSEKYRDEVADQLNTIILAETKAPPRSQLESLLMQLVASQETLRHENGGRGEVFALRNMI